MVKVSQLLLGLLIVHEFLHKVRICLALTSLEVLETVSNKIDKESLKSVLS